MPKFINLKNLKNKHALDNLVVEMEMKILEYKLFISEGQAEPLGFSHSNYQRKTDNHK